MILLFYKSSLLTYCSKWKEKLCRKTLNHTVYLTLTSRFTSVLSSLPFPSLSYILKDHLSRSSRLPRKIKWSAATYSRKSSVLSCLKITKRYIYSEVVHWFLQRQIVLSFYLVCVKRVEYCFYEKGLLYRAAWNSKDLLELMQVQGTAWTLLHENDTQLMNPCQVHLLIVTFFLSHGLCQLEGKNPKCVCMEVLQKWLQGVCLHSQTEELWTAA